MVLELEFEFEPCDLVSDRVVVKDHGRDNAGLTDLKVNIQHLYDIVDIGIMGSRETTKEVNKLVEVVNYASY